MLTTYICQKSDAEYDFYVLTTCPGNIRYKSNTIYILPNT